MSRDQSAALAWAQRQDCRWLADGTLEVATERENPRLVLPAAFAAALHALGMERRLRPCELPVFELPVFRAPLRAARQLRLETYVCGPSHFGRQCAEVWLLGDRDVVLPLYDIAAPDQHALDALVAAFGRGATDPAPHRAFMHGELVRLGAPLRLAALVEHALRGAVALVVNEQRHVLATFEATRAEALAWSPDDCAWHAFQLDDGRALLWFHHEAPA